MRRFLAVMRRGLRPAPDRDVLDGTSTSATTMPAGADLSPSRWRRRADVTLWDAARATGSARRCGGCNRRRQPLGQGLCRQHGPELPGRQAAGPRHGERRAGVPVGQDAARRPDHRARTSPGWRLMRNRLPDDVDTVLVGRERGLVGGADDAGHDAASDLRRSLPLEAAAIARRQHRRLRSSENARQGAARGGLRTTTPSRRTTRR